MLDSVLGMLPTIITVVLGMGGVLLVVKKYMNPVKEAAEVAMAVASALQDGKVTAEELQTIIKEAKDVGIAIKAVSKSSGTKKEE